MTLSVRVKPGSRKNEISEDSSGRLVVKIKGAPVDGKANEALIGFFSEILGIQKSNIQIKSGFNSKNKLLNINHLEEIVKLKIKTLTDLKTG